MLKSACLVVLLFASVAAVADEITFTAVNFSTATFSASASGLSFASATNVLVTDNSTGKSIMLTANDSGNTGAATSFVAGPPLEADYMGSGPGSVLVGAFLSGTMSDDGRLEAEYPDRAGAFLSRFHVDFVDPTILTELGASTHFAPEGSVSLTVAQTDFNGTTLSATLGGAQITIETVSPVPEPTGLGFLGASIMALGLGIRKWNLKSTTSNP